LLALEAQRPDEAIDDEPDAGQEHQDQQPGNGGGGRAALEQDDDRHRTPPEGAEHEEDRPDRYRAHQPTFFTIQRVSGDAVLARATTQSRNAGLWMRPRGIDGKPATRPFMRKRSARGWSAASSRGTRDSVS